MKNDKDKKVKETTRPKATEEVTEEAAEEVVEDPRKSLFYVKVNHLLAEGKERENPVPVNDLGDHAHGKAICYPNRKVILSQVQINILRDAVERTAIAVPEGSGVYEESNPLRAAEKQFPEFRAFRDRNTGLIMLAKERPRFAIEVLGPYKKQ